MKKKGRRIRVMVTAEHIKAGQQRPRPGESALRTHACPLARAISEAVGAECSVTFTNAWIGWRDTPLSKRAAAFRSLADSQKYAQALKPFSFYLTVPE